MKKLLLAIALEAEKAKGGPDRQRRLLRVRLQPSRRRPPTAFRPYRSSRLCHPMI